MGRGPVWGMMTRRAGGPVGATGSAVGASAEASGAALVSGAEAIAEAGAGSAAGGVEMAAGVDAAGAEAVSAGGGGGVAGFVATGATGGAVTSGRLGDAWGGVATATGGRAMTGPAGGLLAIAGGGAGATIFACWRGNGTMRRGAAAPCTPCVTGVPADAGEAGATAFGGVVTAEEDAGGAATTNAGRGGGADLMAASACLRSRIALSASPGFETLERSNFGLLSATGLFEAAERPPALK
jgi:hypothetical protein